MQKFRSGMKMRLDLGCGSAKQPGFIGMDIRKVKGVDIVHNAEKFPYPLPDNCCFQIVMSHLWEHIKPHLRIDLMNELWRIMEPDGQLFIASPYYQSQGAFQDPTHYGCPTENTFLYFCPAFEGLYKIYEPKPWKIVKNDYQAGYLGAVNVVLNAIKETPKKKGGKK